MEQRSITGQAFRVLTDAANGVFHRISMWTHANDVEMESGDNLTTAMKDKYDVATRSVTSIYSVNDIPMNSVGYFEVADDAENIMLDNVTLYKWTKYVYYSFCSERIGTYDRPAQTIFILGTNNLERPEAYMFYNLLGQWSARKFSLDIDLFDLQEYLEKQIGELDKSKYNVDKKCLTIYSLDDLPVNTAGYCIVQSDGIGYYDGVTKTTTKLPMTYYMYFSYQNEWGWKTILMYPVSGATFSPNGAGGLDEGLLTGGGYLCYYTDKWRIVRILSPSDFSSDKTGVREQIVTGITSQIWPVGSIFINLTRQNPGEFLGGTWNLITEGILTAIKGSAEQTGYHQRDLYKAVKDEDRGEHLFGVFAWRRIA